MSQVKAGQFCECTPRFCSSLQFVSLPLPPSAASSVVSIIKYKTTLLILMLKFGFIENKQKYFEMQPFLTLQIPDILLLFRVNGCLHSSCNHVHHTVSRPLFDPPKYNLLFIYFLSGVFLRISLVVFEGEEGMVKCIFKTLDCWTPAF